MATSPQRWEYAELVWAGSGRGDTREVVFTHRDRITGIKGDELLGTLRRLGEDGWEMLTVMHGRASAMLRVEAGKDVWHYYFKRPLGE